MTLRPLARRLAGFQVGITCAVENVGFPGPPVRACPFDYTSNALAWLPEERAAARAWKAQGQCQTVFRPRLCEGLLVR
jgi:hypothetical protein